MANWLNYELRMINPKGQIVGNVTPVWQHDCECGKCEFLGYITEQTPEGDETGPHRDVYVCQEEPDDPTVLIRFGEEPQDNQTMPLSILKHMGLAVKSGLGNELWRCAWNLHCRSRW